mmetsp:Transcript_20235/g.63598  ORF Transcript_20235/g.63598 Transcript_20235/m.63598 type:complete len:353 (+) Transcript_20235:953-2011(+)
MGVATSSEAIAALRTGDAPAGAATALASATAAALRTGDALAGAAAASASAATAAFHTGCVLTGTVAASSSAAIAASALHSSSWALASSTSRAATPARRLSSSRSFSSLAATRPFTCEVRCKRANSAASTPRKGTASQYPSCRDPTSKFTRSTSPSRRSFCSRIAAKPHVCWSPSSSSAAAASRWARRSSCKQRFKRRRLARLSARVLLSVRSPRSRMSWPAFHGGVAKRARRERCSACRLNSFVRRAPSRAARASLRIRASVNSSCRIRATAISSKRPSACCVASVVAASRLEVASTDSARRRPCAASAVRQVASLWRRAETASVARATSSCSCRKCFADTEATEARPKHRV